MLGPFAFMAQARGGVLDLGPRRYALSVEGTELYRVDLEQGQRERVFPF